MSWRREAKDAMRLYPKALRKRAVPGAALTPREERALDAVEFVLRMQRVYPSAEARLLMIRKVYFQRSATLEGAAQACNYSRGSIQQWDTEILTAVYVALARGPGRGTDAKAPGPDDAGPGAGKRGSGD